MHFPLSARTLRKEGVRMRKASHQIPCTRHCVNDAFVDQLQSLQVTPQQANVEKSIFSYVHSNRRRIKKASKCTDCKQTSNLNSCHVMPVRLIVMSIHISVALRSGPPRSTACLRAPSAVSGRQPALPASQEFRHKYFKALC